MNALGVHLIVELKECDPALLNDLDHVRESMIQAAQVVGAHILNETFHQFNPVVVTGVVAISESHLCIHTWPEYGYAAVDIFTCGDTVVPRKAAHYLIERFRARSPSITELKRGVLLGLVSTKQPQGV